MAIGPGLTDLDELVLTCRTERARDYIQEALQSYRSGAYRAAVVVTWIAVVFDLVDKLRELDTSGDAQAKIVITDFDNTLEQLAQGDRTILPKALQFEREILDLVRSKFQLLDDHQHVDLQRLLEDRNRCAHPTFDMGGGIFRPSAEAARTHIRNAIAHVLQQPPVQGKAAIESVLSKVRSSYFPSSPELVQQSLKQQIERARPALINGLVDRLLWDATGTNTLYANPADITALTAILELHRPVAEPRVRSQISKMMSIVDDSKLAIAASIVASIPEAWESLDAVQRDRFNNFIANGQIIVTAYIIKLALEKTTLRNYALKRIATMSAPELAQIIAVGVRSEAVDQAVEIFSRCGSFASANYASTYLIMPLIDLLSPDHIRTIIKSPTERGSDLRYASGTPPFVAAVRELGVISTDD